MTLNMYSISEIWNAVCEELKKSISLVGFNTWFRDLKLTDVGAGTVTVNVPSMIKMNIVDLNYRKTLEKSFAAVLGFNVTLLLTCAETAAKRESFSDNQSSVREENNFSFDNFIVGPSNRFAHAAAKAVAENPANIYNPFFIYGPSGVGKTHLMFAIENEILKKHPEKKSIYVRGEDFTNSFIQALSTGKIPEFNNRFRNVDVFLLDDIQFIAGKDSTQEAFFNTFDSLYQNHKQIVLTSDRPAKDIKSLDDRIRSRCESGLPADIQPPDYETRVGIIRSKADMLGIEIPDEIIFYIAEQVTRNTRQIEGIVKKIHAHVQMDNKMPNIAMVHGYIKDIVNDVSVVKITPQKIIEEISRTYNISEEDIISSKRSAPIAHARQVAMYVIRQVNQLTYEDIGKIFGRDHATVLYTIQKVEQMIKMDPSEKNIVEDIVANLENIN